MARYVTPFLVVNLGAEMVFVVAQRLQAQEVPHERSAFVLDEIISVLIAPQLINEISRPQSAYTHQAVKDLIDDVAQSSAMRLDPKSMDKLWDLITMVFKWQLTSSTDLLTLTARHLYEIESYVHEEETHLQLHKIQNLFAGFNKLLNQNEKNELREKTLLWLTPYNVRVSLLLRLGLQTQTGSFTFDNLSEKCHTMLVNLGENIYTLKKDKQDDKNGDEALELKLLVEQISGKRAENKNVLRLAINQNPIERNDFVVAKVEHEVDQAAQLFDDLNIENETETNFHDELIKMMEDQI